MRGIHTFALLTLAFGLTGCLRGPDLNEVTEVRHGTAPGLVHVRVESRTSGWHSSSSWVLDDEASILSDVADQPRPPRTEDCAGTDCYRVVSGQLRVEQRHGDPGSYVVAWQVSDGTYRELAAAHRGLGDPAVHLSSRSLVVHQVADGHVVFVANGRDGVLYRDTRGGWHRLGTPQGGEGYYFDPPPRLATDPRPLDLTWYAVAGVALLVMLAGMITNGGRRSFQIGKAWRVVAVALSAGAVTLLGARFPDVGMFPGFFYGIPIILAALVVGMRAARRIAKGWAGGRAHPSVEG